MLLSLTRSRACPGFLCDAGLDAAAPERRQVQCEERGVEVLQVPSQGPRARLASALSSNCVEKQAMGRRVRVFD